MIHQTFNAFSFRNIFWLESIGSLTMDEVYFRQPFAICQCFYLKWPCSKDSLWTRELLTISWILEYVYLVYLWPGYLTELRILSWTMPHTFTNCLLGQWGRVQHKWYQGSKSCLIYFAGDVCKRYCPALVNKSRAGQQTLVSISRNIMHGTKAAKLPW